MNIITWLCCSAPTQALRSDGIPKRGYITIMIIWYKHRIVFSSVEHLATVIYRTIQVCWVYYSAMPYTKCWSSRSHALRIQRLRKRVHERVMLCAAADVIISNVCGFSFNKWSQGPAIAFMTTKSYANITNTRFIDNTCPPKPQPVSEPDPDTFEFNGGELSVEHVSISSCGGALIECEDVHVALQNVEFTRHNSCGAQCPPDVEIAVRSCVVFLRTFCAADVCMCFMHCSALTSSHERFLYLCKGNSSRLSLPKRCFSSTSHS